MVEQDAESNRGYIGQLKLLFDQMQLSKGAQQRDLETLERHFGITVPDDYRKVLTWSNGMEGVFGSAYLAVWAVDEVINANAGYQISTFAPGLVLIASNRGGTGYGFDTRREPYVVREYEFAGGPYLDDCRIRGTSFANFLKRLYDEG